MMNILNPHFKYVNSANTDISKTIKREQKRLEELRQKQKVLDEEAARVVTDIKKERRG
jgi:hypothetical protein